jgi:DNA-binding NtrC family response regulator
MRAASDYAPAMDRILVVDDDAAARAVLLGLLTEIYDVDAASGADEAMRLLRKAQYQVVISDYEMPGGSGLELLKTVAMTYPNVIGVLLTGHAEKREVREADRERRVFAVLNKPYDPEDLLRSVRLAIATAHMRQVSSSGKHRVIGMQE